MAEVQLMETQLRLVFQMGVDEEGKPMLKNKNFNNIDTQATADQLLSAAQAIASLQSKTLVHVERNDSQQINA
ncbi:DUF1659 domain-containing protein [Bacillus alveayuensis]|jgi:hypothetical protein|uniref:DUF1659 domain-containing protein n=1 Tax=Aeribacillus alveayuensis TaxID=279215 RepID=UPI0005CD01D3|nr:DUF1659 domain-containing protein [Bacillus alveayuensis]